uniref:Protein krueppel n=1 Tax=Anopheles christyi TaxID=43041 RepID=A0A182K392_9DIPT
MEIVREKMRAEKLKKSQTCRFCLVQNVPLTSIFVVQDQNITTPLPLQIMSCVGIEVYREDGMPGVICENCRVLTNYCYQFKQMCNNANTQLKSFLTTGVWPKQLSLPKEIATLLPNVKPTSVPTTKAAVSAPVQTAGGEVVVKDKQKSPNIIKLSLADLKNFKQGQKLNVTNRTQPQTDQTSVTGDDETNESSRVPLMTSTPIVKRQGSDLANTASESHKPAKPVLQQSKGKKEQKSAPIQQESSGAQNGPLILNNLVQSVVSKVEEEFVSTGDGTVEMVVTYVPDEPATSDNVFPCSECPRTYPLKQLLDIHQLSHKRERKHLCDQCDKRFFSKYDLAKHITTHTGERPYVCVICRASFSRSSLLIRHQAKHHDEPKHICTLCERTFLTLEELKKHAENHEKSRPFKCSVCPKSFAYKQGLERHEVVHSEKLPYQCEHCDQSYLTAGKLSRHLATHAGERPYPCRLCNKSFLLSHHLSRHLRRHNATGQSEYKCSDCGELFNSLGDLVYHSAKHAMQSLTCPLCREPFDSVEAVTMHIRSHSEQKQHYACDYCDLMYTNEQKLGDHCLQHHANELAYELPDEKCGQWKGKEEIKDDVEATGDERNDFVMDYVHIEEEEIMDNDLFLDEGTSSPKSTSPAETKSATNSSKEARVNKVQANINTTATKSASSQPRNPPPVAVQSQEDAKMSRQQRMEEFFKRNQQAVEKRMAQQKLSDVLKSLPKGVTVKMESTEKQASTECDKTSASTATISTTETTPAPQKRGPGRPAKPKPVEAKDVKGVEKIVPKTEAPKAAAAPPKRSFLPAKTEKPAADGKRELKRSVSAMVISKERTKPSTVGQENATASTAKVAADVKPPSLAASKSSDSQSWMIKRTYAPKSETSQDTAAPVGKKRPAEKNGDDGEEAAPNKRPALGRKTLNPSMLRTVNKKEPMSSKPNVPGRASTVIGSASSATSITTSTSAATANNIVNVKNIPKADLIKRIPMEMNIGGKTIKVHKITKEEAIARANQLKGKQ